MAAREGRLQSWCDQAPWAMFGLAPVLFLGAAYFVACLILWSGWRIYLPESSTPFVRSDGFSIYYFGVGRLLYYSAPILVGWGVGLIAARQRLKAAWPMVGLVLVALIGATARVHASRPPVSGGVGGRVSMDLAFGSSLQDISDHMVYALVILSLTALPYLIWRFRKTHSISA